MTTDEVRLQAHEVSRSYGTFEALSGLSFELRAGEILGLLGPNGAGKTTAIRVLTTILPPSSGSFALGGHPHTRPDEIRRLIGVLPESSGYPLHLEGLEYLEFYGRLFGQPRERAHARAMELLALVGLEERARSRIGTYSRGMRQRLGIARAVVNDPAVLFLDEPTLGFDPRGQREVLTMISSISRERGASVVLSTHFLEAVEQVCSRVLILRRGRVVEDGLVADVKRRVTVPRVGRFNVPPPTNERALSTFNGFPGVVDVRPLGTGPGGFLVTLGEEGASTAEEASARMNQLVAALVEAHVPILSFTLESASLSDAFLEITQEA